MAQLCSTRSAVSEAKAAVASTWVDAGAVSAALTGASVVTGTATVVTAAGAVVTDVDSTASVLAVDDATADGVVSVAIGTTSLDGRRVIVGSATAAASAAGLSSPDPMPSTSGISKVRSRWRHRPWRASNGSTPGRGVGCDAVSISQSSSHSSALGSGVSPTFVRPVRRRRGTVGGGGSGQRCSGGPRRTHRSGDAQGFVLEIDGVSCVAARSAVLTNARTPPPTTLFHQRDTVLPAPARGSGRLLPSGHLWPVGVVAPEVVVVRRHRLVTSFARSWWRSIDSDRDVTPERRTRRPDVRPRVYLIRHETATSVSCKRHVCHSNDKITLATTRVGDGAMTARRTTHRSGATIRAMAERVGFEPTDHIAAINALAGRPIRPLWHLSWEPRSVARYPRSRNGGRVDECSRLESGRPQGSGVRIPPVPPMGFWRFAEIRGKCHASATTTAGHVRSHAARDKATAKRAVGILDIPAASS